VNLQILLCSTALHACGHQDYPRYARPEPNVNTAHIHTRHPNLTAARRCSTCSAHISAPPPRRLIPFLAQHSMAMSPRSGLQRSGTKWTVWSKSNMLQQQQLQQQLASEPFDRRIVQPTPLLAACLQRCFIGKNVCSFIWILQVDQISS
jgi:hypothetical protein